MKKFFDLFRPKKQPITIVSGLPRSGTSMMMKMLEAGGIPPLTDNIRTADDDNPKGYYEFERAKKLREGDTDWLPQARGKAVKVISALLQHLPANYDYKVIFMRRAMPEILASQRKMLINRGENPDKVSDKEMTKLYEKHLTKVLGWLEEQKNFDVLHVNYNAALADPTPYIPKINAFLGNSPDVEKMAGVIDPNLYRQRRK
ncbi:MAG: sulfotransferase domain-containing protein [Anaerolineales bacterium]